MERKFNCTEEQAMDYSYAARMEEMMGRHAELPEELKIVCGKISEGLCDGVVLVGTSGSGGVSYAKLMARELNAPIFRLSFTEGTRLDDFYMSETFREPIEKGGFLVIDGMEFCRDKVQWWLENWFICTLAGQKLEKPKLEDFFDVPVYTLSPNFVLVLVLDPNYLRRSLSRISMAWTLKYPTYVVYGDPNLIEIRKLYKEVK